MTKTITETIKTITETGYIAIDRAHPKKGLKNYRVGTGIYGCNMQVLTTDLEDITLAESEDCIKMYCSWYNEKNKRQVDFEIIKIKRTKTITIDQVV